MTDDKRPIRIGIPAREAAERWEANARTILQSDLDADDVDVDVERVDGRTWEWTIGEVESGRIEFIDAGEGTGELVIDLERSDQSAGDRIRSIVNRFSRSVVGESGGIDPPVVAIDPHQGEPPEAATDPDQPL
ncbi:MAG TPA: hypothetical protein VHL52_00530 [Acidimicrobiia bacterium]|nr:hypothetical protein [Acidimicrobiia bacterium]